MRILVCGAYGFIGAAIVAALRDAGHDVLGAVRASRVGARGDALPTIACDFARDVEVATWLPRLAGIDAVVNAAGVLRETRGATFEAIHHHAPAALAAACARLGIGRFVQVSALGDPDDVPFLASKHRGDAAILAAMPGAVILRPGLVYSAHGAYGGTSLLRAIAALPLVPLPAGGGQLLQPLALEDLACAVVRALGSPPAAGRTIELVGPETLTLRDWLARWRAWLGFGVARTVSVPRALVRFGGALGEAFGDGPIGRATTTMLARGVVGHADALPTMRATLDLAPIAPAIAMRRPAQAQDRWHARLYFAAPLLRGSLALVWLASGALGLLLAGETIVATMRPPGWSPEATLVLARAGAGVDALLGLALLAGLRTKPVLLAMLAQTLAYTLVLGVAWPALWLDPWGGLLKNLVLVAALLAAHATADRH